MLVQALSIYRRQFGALLLTCALALLPANLVMSGAVVLGFASLGAGGVAGAPTHTQQIQKKQSDLHESPPAPEDSALRMRQLGREAFEGGSVFDPGAIQTLLLMTFALLCAVAILIAGLSLAHAAVVPLVLGTAAGPARAWAIVASRMRALVWTVLLSVPLIALGMLCLVVPGIVLALRFAFAMPVVISEGLSGRAALERSWALSRGRWGQLFAIFVLIAFLTALASVFSLLAPAGPWRAVISSAVRLLTYPLPLVALVLLYARARKLEGAWQPHSDQYIRRISAPG